MTFDLEGSLEELVGRLLDRWRLAGVSFNPAATLSDVEEFERLHQVKLPLDLRVFVLKVDGMPYNEMDELTHICSLRHYSRIISRVPRHSAVPDADDYFCFGDYNIGGSFYGIRLIDQTDYPARVRVFWRDGNGWQCAASFRDFVLRYLQEGPHSMF